MKWCAWYQPFSRCWQDANANLSGAGRPPGPGAVLVRPAGDTWPWLRKRYQYQAPGVRPVGITWTLCAAVARAVTVADRTTFVKRSSAASSQVTSASLV